MSGEGPILLRRVLSPLTAFRHRASVLRSRCTPGHLTHTENPAGYIYAVIIRIVVWLPRSRTDRQTDTGECKHGRVGAAYCIRPLKPEDNHSAFASISINRRVDKVGLCDSASDQLLLVWGLSQLPASADKEIPNRVTTVLKCYIATDADFRASKQIFRLFSASNYY